MIRKVLVLTAALAGAALAASPAGAQMFKPGYTDLGPTIGLGSIGGANVAIGVRFAHGIKPLPSIGNGTLGIEASLDYYSWNCGAAGYTCSVTYVPIGVTANYHFVIQDQPKWDPFLGLGLGYRAVSCSISGLPSCGYSSNLYFIGRAGARYFFQPKMALYADLGSGASTLNVGLMFKLH